MTEFVDDYLEHYGVKGMKWGVKNSGRPSGAPRKGPSNDTLKKIGAEIGFGSLGPAAVLAGLGPPVSIAIGLSVTVLRQPAVKNAIAETSKAQAALLKEFKDTKVSAMREAREARDDIQRGAARTRNRVAAAGAAAAAAGAGAAVYY